MSRDMVRIGLTRYRPRTIRTRGNSPVHDVREDEADFFLRELSGLDLAHGEGAKRGLLRVTVDIPVFDVKIKLGARFFEFHRDLPPVRKTHSGLE